MIFDVESMKKTLVEFEVSEQIRSYLKEDNFVTLKLPSQPMRNETRGACYFCLSGVPLA